MLTVTVGASDEVGVGYVEIGCTGVVSVAERVVISPAQPNVAHIFQVSVPVTAK